MEKRFDRFGYDDDEARFDIACSLIHNDHLWAITDNYYVNGGRIWPNLKQGLLAVFPTISAEENMHNALMHVRMDTSGPKNLPYTAD